MSDGGRKTLSLSLPPSLPPSLSFSIFLSISPSLSLSLSLTPFLLPIKPLFLFHLALTSRTSSSASKQSIASNNGSVSGRARVSSRATSWSPALALLVDFRGSFTLFASMHSQETIHACALKRTWWFPCQFRSYCDTFLSVKNTIFSL